MEDPGSGWALGINLHNRAEDEQIFSRMITRIPDIKSLELWLSMPHRHLILDSSPRYQALYWFSPWDKERTEMLQTKYESLKRSKEFTNVVGDVWIKILLENHSEMGRIENEFTIIGFSPWIGNRFQKVASELEDQVRDLVRIKDLEEILQKQEADIEKKYISYKDSIIAWGLFASLLTVTLTAIVLIVRELAGVSIPIQPSFPANVVADTQPTSLTLGVIMKFAILCSIMILALVNGGKFVLKRLGLIRNR
jgi:hypothetical protein